MVRFAVYASSSLLLASGVIGYAYYTRVQFYPIVIYLVTSKFSIMTMGNMALVLTLFLGRVTKKIFLGTLRDAEVETLYENSRYAITETCLALTIFREEINLRVVALFTALLFTKIFHWLCQSRVEHVEQAEIVSRLTHFRILALMGCLSAVDVVLVTMCSMKVIEQGPSVLILFGFEFLILFITLVAIFIRYILHLVDLRVDGTWTNKSTYVFYLELLSEVTKLFVYLVFFMIIFTYYGMPLHIVRDLWVSLKNLQNRISAYLRYRSLTANMNERFASPTEEELEENDRTCIICREEMTPLTAKKLPCTHIFHLNCLRMWLQRQQTCPTCRSEIPTNPPPTVPTVQNPQQNADQNPDQNPNQNQNQNIQNDEDNSQRQDTTDANQGSTSSLQSEASSSPSNPTTDIPQPTSIQASTDNSLASQSTQQTQSTSNSHSTNSLSSIPTSSVPVSVPQINPPTSAVPPTTLPPGSIPPGSLPQMHFGFGMPMGFPGMPIPGIPGMPMTPMGSSPNTNSSGSLPQSNPQSFPVSQYPYGMLPFPVIDPSMTSQELLQLQIKQLQTQLASMQVSTQSTSATTESKIITEDLPSNNVVEQKIPAPANTARTSEVSESSETLSRREELRQRYARIYGEKVQSSNDQSETDIEEKKPESKKNM